MTCDLCQKPIKPGEVMLSMPSISKPQNIHTACAKRMTDGVTLALIIAAAEEARAYLVPERKLGPIIDADKFIEALRKMKE